MHEGDNSTMYIGQDMFMFMFHLQDPNLLLITNPTVPYSNPLPQLHYHY